MESDTGSGVAETTQLTWAQAGVASPHGRAAFKTISVIPRPGNGSLPVRTWKMLVNGGRPPSWSHTWWITNLSGKLSASGVGIGSVIPNFEGSKSSGCMNIIVPPSNCALHDIGWPGSSTIIVNPKSARQARGGLPLNINARDAARSGEINSRSSEIQTYAPPT